MKKQGLFLKAALLYKMNFLQAENMQKKLVGNYIMYYLPDTGEKIVYILSIVYGKQNTDEILKKLDI